MATEIVTGTPRVCGIYAIYCEPTGHVYIGATVDAAFRYHAHFALLRRGSHQNCQLQNLFNEHGESSFAFVLLEECVLPQLDARPDMLDLRPLGRLEHEWQKDIRAELGTLLVNPRNCGVNGQVTCDTPMNRAKQRFCWPPLRRGGPPKRSKPGRPLTTKETP